MSEIENLTEGIKHNNIVCACVCLYTYCIHILYLQSLAQ